VLIKNYYISGIYSTNSRSERSFYAYGYLTNDYNTVNEVLDLLTIQLESMHVAGYPTSPTYTISATATIIIDDPPTDELDDDLIETTTIIIPPELSSDP